MFAGSSRVEKSFEIWPGLLTLTVSGQGALDAIDAGMDEARDLSLALLADAELLASGTGNVLPRGKAGRLSLEAMHAFRGAAPNQPLPPSLAAMPGAICDIVLAAMLEAAGEAGGADFIVVTIGDVAAIHQESGVLLPQDLKMPAVLAEFIVALGGGVQGGAAIGGMRSIVPTCGLLDIVATQSRSAALAGLAAAGVADAALGAATQSGEVSRDRLVALAWRDRAVGVAAGLVEPEAIWAALSDSVRRAQAFREKRLLRAAALGLKGRGRTLGPVDGDRLLRFGVSEWR